MNTVQKKKSWFHKHFKSNTQFSSRENVCKTLNKLQFIDDIDHLIDKNILTVDISHNSKKEVKIEENLLSDSFSHLRMKNIDGITTNRLLNSLFKYIKKKLSSSHYVSIL